MSNDLGFSLAEMLISLVIIGIVSALTVPVLVANNAQAASKAAYIKLLSTLNQAVTTNVTINHKDFSQLASGNCISPGTICYMFNDRIAVVTLDSAVDDVNLDPVGNANPIMASSSNYTLFFLDSTVFSFPTACGYSTLENPCKGVVDINGGKRPNMLTNCFNDPGVVSEPTVECTSENIKIGDRYSIRFGGGVVLPNGPGARYVLYN